MRKINILLIFFLASANLLANNINDLTISEIFTPIAGDASIKIIQYIFGGVSSIEALSNMPENQLVNDIFRILNVGVLFIAGILLSYTVYTTAIRTAQDAGMSQMGRLTPMTVVRIFTGLTLMSPLPNVGFSTIQLGILWAAVHGVGFADTIYKSVINEDKLHVLQQDKIDKARLSTDIKVITQRLPLINSENKNISEEMNNNYIKTLQSLDNIFKDLEPIDIISPDRSSIDQNGPLENSIVNIDQLYASVMCLATAKQYYKKNTMIMVYTDFKQTNICPEGSNLCFALEKEEGGMRAICGAYNVPKFMIIPVYNALLLAKNNFDMLYPIYNITYDKNLTLYDPLKENIKNIANEIKQLSYKEKKVPEKIEKKKDYGWISAGHMLDKIVSSYQYEGEDKRENPNILIFDQASSLVLNIINTIAKNYYILSKNDYFYSSVSICDVPGISFFAMCNDTQMLNSIPIEIKKLVAKYIAVFFGVHIDNATKYMLNNNRCSSENAPYYHGCFSEAIERNTINIPNTYSKSDAGILGYTELARRNLFSFSPVEHSKLIGINLLGFVFNFWKSIPDMALTTSGKLFTKYRSLLTFIGTISAIIQSTTELIPYAGEYVTAGIDLATSLMTTSLHMPYQIDINNFFRYLPAAGFISIIVFLAGLMLAVWVPLLPVLIFSLAIIGWLFYLIEAMVAAPLIAVGITHPEGHDFLGQAQQSFMLLLMVFLRPIIILLGLITALAIFYAASYLFHLGFISFVVFAIDGVVSFKSISILFTMLLIYSFILASLAQASFSNIFRVVERVSLWLGGQPEQSPISQIISKIKGDIMQKSQQVGMGASISISDSNQKTGLGQKGKIDSSTPMSEASKKATSQGTTS